MIVKLIIGAVAIGVLIVHEVGEYAEDVNPFNRYDAGEDFDGSDK